MHRDVKRIGWFAALVATALTSQAAHAETVYNYVGANLTYTGLSGSFTYGDRLIAQLTFADEIVTPGFSGTLDSTQFSALIGGQGGQSAYSLQAATPGGYNEMDGPTGGFKPAFVTFSQGVIIDWNFGTTYQVGLNNVTISTNSQRDSAIPWPRQVFWAIGRTTLDGTWTLQSTPTPVPLPGAVYLLFSGVAALAAARRAGRRSAANGRLSVALHSTAH